jgi:glucose/arabinose dehydrogenase
MVRFQAALLILGLCTVAGAQNVVDPTLRVQRWVSGLDQPTGAAFFGDGDAFIIEKNSGRVKLLRNRSIAGTVLDLPVANDGERGLLGIAISPDFATNKQVYLYHTVANADGGSPITNRVSRYIWNGTSLSLDRNIINLPSDPSSAHNGGKILFDRKGKLFVQVGDVGRNERTQNLPGSDIFSRTSAILRLNPSGTPVTNNPFFSTANTGGNRILNEIYAYGVRNGFGIAIDPLGQALWDTENGPQDWDEINRLNPGSNSGWRTYMGPSSRIEGFDDSTLVSLGRRAHYMDPQFAWKAPVAPTDLHFNEGPHLGDEYRNDLFVGDQATGSLYHFELSPTRKSLVLAGPLLDKVADNTRANRLLEQESIIWGSGFGIVTDILNGPGGLYVLSLDQGALYRINRQPGVAGRSDFGFQMIPEPSGLVSMGLLGAVLSRRRLRNSRS